jgi:hypothetical protein
VLRYDADCAKTISTFYYFTEEALVLGFFLNVKTSPP